MLQAAFCPFPVGSNEEAPMKSEDVLVQLII